MKKQFLLLQKIKQLMCLCTLSLLPFSGINAQLVINEIMPANSSQFLDPTYNYSGWIELYNPGENPVPIYGYYLSDDPSQPRKYRIGNFSSRVPKKGYLVYWFDHNDLLTTQANFKLNCAGGELTLYNSQGNPVASVVYPEQVLNTSYARTSDGLDAWGFCTTPTPGKTNTGATFAYERCPEPSFNLKGGVYKSAVTVTLTCPAGMDIHYTTDGSEPTLTSAKWTETKQFSQTTVLRARILADGYMPGNITTHSYIISSREFTLPVVSIVTDHKNLWDTKIGIYCRGTNGITGNGETSPANWNRDWGRPANIEILGPSEQMFSQECEISIGGGWSRAYNLKSLKVNAEKKFDGRNHFLYPFFEAKPGLRYKSLSLRNSGNDFYNTMMSDGMQQSLVEGVLDVEHQAYQPTVHYINGEYYGIINLRERNNHQYVYANFGYDKDSIDLIEKNPEGTEVLNGTITALNNLVTKSAGAATPSVYEAIKEEVDIDEFIAYIVTEMYSGNWDWPVNNTKLFRHQNNGKWRWTLYDLDGGFQQVNYNPFTGEANSITSSSCNGLHTVQLFKNLIKNTAFKERFVDYFTICLGSVFRPERVHHIVDSLAARIRTEIPYHQQRWNTTYGFESGVNGFKTFASGRIQPLVEQIRSFFSLGSPVGLTIKGNVPNSTLLMNDIPIPLRAMEGYTFAGKTLNLKAIAPPGYEFERWSVINSSEDVISPYGATWSYYDSGSLDGRNWSQLSYNATSWSSGKAPLGYGKRGIATTLDYGGNANSKHPTAYMRQNFTLNTLNSTDEFTLYLAVDDGAIVYLNGNEIGRHLMPAGTVTFNTYATTYAAGNPDQVSFTIPASSFRKGLNTLAVEVHQNQASSTDLYLDAQVVRSSATPSVSYAESEITLIAERTLNLLAEFTKKEEIPGVVRTPVRINEVSASNNIHMNEYYKKEDWIELYNTTDKPVSIAGLYISRDQDNLTQYQIPNGPKELTVIPPYGYRILWADKMDDLTQLHLPFKLPAEGVTLQLSHIERNAQGEQTVLWKDVLEYSPHTAVQTFGRYPDGSDSIYVMNRTTFAASNYFSIYNISRSDLINDPTEGITLTENKDGNGISIYYNPSAATITVETIEEFTAPQNLIIYSLAGQPQASHRIPAYQSTYSMELSELPSGYYIAVLYTPNGEKVTFRFVK